MKVSNRWKKQAVYYQRFARCENNLDFSDDAAMAMFLHESRGDAAPNSNNGFLRGKWWMDITIPMWKQDLQDGLLFLKELFEDGYEPEFLANVLGWPQLAAVGSPMSEENS